MKKTILPVAAVFLALTLAAWLKPHTPYSAAERRPLAARPALSAADFMSDFETYALDQFPLRDTLRSLKAFTALELMQRRDNNRVFRTSDSHISKLDYPLDPQMLEHAASRFTAIYDQYLANSNCKIYFAPVPDKNYYIPDGILKLDYNALFSYFKEKLPQFTHVDLTPTLGLNNYYRTDSHWRQESLGLTAKALGDAMGADVTAQYEQITLPQGFYGVYAGQLALPVKPDTLTHLTNEMLKSCTLTSYDTGAATLEPIYDLDAAAGRDPYELYMGGGDALQVLENPAAPARELVIFRDSFASSLAPLLAPGYSKITLVDTRYIQPSLIGNYVDFENADVLFLYSTTLLNNSLALK